LADLNATIKDSPRRVKAVWDAVGEALVLAG